ncbi:hypothetical protein SAMN05444411_103214 [Lutibacter oricola]|uniref:Uncharacterized protein n=1 Tax=Lutibacter oricola TaxID=762486 RepID=A0A1H2ZDA6_9FLAO|nr:hypothetical protein [Lutibacter oricola]SDX15307.1 hypothetical protein SAMN05444411_103214 [Lutibacter oricola]
MKAALKEIKPGYGLGVLKFGMSRAEVKLILGEPTSIDKYSYTNSLTELTESWEYTELSLSLSFDEDEDWKLMMFSVTNNFYEFENLALIGLSEEKVTQSLAQLKFEDLYLEDFSEQDDEDQKMLEIEDKSLNFWFVDGALDEIQWSPLFIDDDTIDWPS